jgi:hypothetical protein
MDFKGMCRHVHWVDLALGIVHLRILVNMVINLRCTKKAGKLFIRRETISFSRRNMPHIHALMLKKVEIFMQNYICSIYFAKNSQYRIL